MELFQRCMKDSSGRSVRDHRSWAKGARLLLRLVFFWASKVSLEENKPLTLASFQRLLLHRLQTGSQIVAINAAAAVTVQLREDIRVKQKKAFAELYEYGRAIMLQGPPPPPRRATSGSTSLPSSSSSVFSTSPPSSSPSLLPAYVATARVFKHIPLSLKQFAAGIFQRTVGAIQRAIDCWTWAARQLHRNGVIQCAIPRPLVELIACTVWESRKDPRIWLRACNKQAHDLDHFHPHPSWPVSSSSSLLRATTKSRHQTKRR